MRKGECRLYSRLRGSGARGSCVGSSSIEVASNSAEVASSLVEVTVLALPTQSRKLFYTLPCKKTAQPHWRHARIGENGIKFILLALFLLIFYTLGRLRS